ncbi:MAG: hypothetical protein Q4F05_11180 [bacterium]|nr:hypothetical protein [bacterium]
MKTSKLVIGILSIIMFVIVSMQSCAVGIGNALSESEEISGSAGFLLAICLLVAGIIGICVKNSTKKGPYVAGGFYIFGAIIAYCNIGTYSDLGVWAFISFAFGLVFIVPNFIHNRKQKQVNNNE